MKILGVTQCQLTHNLPYLHPVADTNGQKSIDKCFNNYLPIYLGSTCWTIIIRDPISNVFWFDSESLWLGVTTTFCLHTPYRTTSSDSIANPNALGTIKHSYLLVSNNI